MLLMREPLTRPAVLLPGELGRARLSILKGDEHLANDMTTDKTQTPSSCSERADSGSFSKAAKEQWLKLFGWGER